MHRASLGDDRRGLHLAISLGLAMALIVTLIAQGFAAVTPAHAAGPAMTTSINTVNASVLTGGRASYNVRIECSNLDPTGCTKIKIEMTPPTSADGSVIATDPQVDSSHVTGTSSDPGTGNWTLSLRDMVAGSSVQFQVSWQIPNFTTPDGTQLTLEATTTFDGPDGNPTTVIAQAPSPVTADAAPKVQVNKRIIDPSAASQVMPGDTATYEIRVCIPENELGQIAIANAQVVDTYDAWTNGAQSVIVEDADGGTINPANHTITWNETGIDTQPNQPICGSGNELVYTVVLTYPAAMIPTIPGGDVQATYTFQNRAEATVTATNGETATGSSVVNHAFFNYNTPPGLLVIAYKHLGVGAPIAKTDTSTEYSWFMSVAYRRGNDVNPTELRNATIVDRIPCVLPGGVQSLGVTNNAASAITNFIYAQDGDLTGWSGGAEGLCSTPAFRTSVIELTGDNSTDTQRSIDRLDYVSVKYYDTATSLFGQAIWRVPTGVTPTTRIYVYDTTQAQTLAIPATAVVTDLVVNFENVPLENNNGSGQKINVHGTNTTAFATSPHHEISNVERTYVSNEQTGPDQGFPLSPSDAPTGSGLAGANTAGAGRSFDDEVTDLTIGKQAASSVAALRPGDIATWSLTAGLGVTNTRLGIAPKVVDVLPIGLEYVPGSTTWTLGSHTAPTETVETFTDGAGYTRTRIVWQFAADFNGGDTVTGTFQTTVTLDAAEGSHAGTLSAQTAAIYDADRSRNEGSGEPDTNDWDGDGDVTELVKTASDDWTVVAQSGAHVEKFVRGSAGDGTWQTEDVSLAELAHNSTAATDGTDVDYLIRASNDENQSLQNLVIYDVLPHLGDTAIGADLRGDARGSQFQVNFAQLLGTLPAGTSIQYSTSNNPCRPELFPANDQGACANDWSSTLPTDPTTVRALRLTIDHLAPGDQAEVTFRGTVPLFVFAQGGNQVCAASRTNPSIRAWNNIAFQAERVTGPGTTEDLLPAEAPKVSIREVCGRIGDFVWYDKNHDGIQGTDEVGVPGVTIQLLDENGDPVLDGAGQPVTTVTDSDGYYSFEVPVGTWTVQVVSIPDGYVFTLPNVGDDAKDSDAGAILTPAAPVVITPAALENLTLDFGLWQPSPQIDIEKYDIDGNDADTADEKVALPQGSTTLTFTIRNTGDEALVDVTVTDTITAGQATVSGLTCTFPDQTTGTTWAGPFAIGGSFDCTAQLTGVTAGDDHADSATVTGTGEGSGKPVTDSDDYHGYTPSPAIDIEKLDVDGNDADTEKETVEVESSTIGLDFIVRNTGTEDLTEIKVSDSLLKGKARVKGLTCTFPDESTGTTWNGVFKVGASFTCTAKVTGLVPDDLHADRASVTGKGVFTRTSVSDDDDYHAKRLVIADDEEEQEEDLPLTGANAALAAALSLGLLGAGALLIAARRRLQN
ncbi:hypothetical protein GCM10010401_09530 [Rarobacter faecitabidus]